MKKANILIAYILLLITALSVTAQPAIKDSIYSSTQTGKLLNHNGKKAKIGDVAPDFKASFADGTEFHLSETYSSGKYVLLNFSNTGCGWCFVFYPNLINFQKQYGNKLMIVCVYGDAKDEDNNFQVPERWDEVAKVMFRENFERVKKYALPSLWQAGFLNPAYNNPATDGWPTCILISPDGEIVGKVSGANDKKLSRLLEKHLH